MGVFQGAPCFTAVDPDQMKKENSRGDPKPRHSVGEVTIANLASPARNRRHAKGIGESPAQGGRKLSAVASEALPLPSPQTSSRKSKSPNSQSRKQGKPTGGKVQSTHQAKPQRGEPAQPSRLPGHHASAKYTPSQGQSRSKLPAPSPEKQGTAARQPPEHCGDFVSEAPPPSSSASSSRPPTTPQQMASVPCEGFIDDIRLRPRVKSSASSKIPHHGSSIARESSDVHDASAVRRGSLDNINSEGDEWQCDLDVSEILHGREGGLPVLGSDHGHSLDESMMGGVDESFERDGPREGPFFSVPDLPEPRLSCRPSNVAAGAPQPQPQAPARTVFFPAPPENAAKLVYHKGHYQGWSQRSTSRSLSPTALLTM